MKTLLIFCLISLSLLTPTSANQDGYKDDFGFSHHDQKACRDTYRNGGAGVGSAAGCLIGAGITKSPAGCIKGAGAGAASGGLVGDTIGARVCPKDKK